MKRANDEVILAVTWEQWVALGMRGQDWLRMIATGSESLPDGGYRIKMADYRLPEFFEWLAKQQ